MSYVVIICGFDGQKKQTQYDIGEDFVRQICGIGVKSYWHGLISNYQF